MQISPLDQCFSTTKSGVTSSGTKEGTVVKEVHHVLTHVIDRFLYTDFKQNDIKWNRFYHGLIDIKTDSKHF